MVGEKAVSPQMHFTPRVPFRHQSPIRLIVVFTQERGLASVAALCDARASLQLHVISCENTSPDGDGRHSHASRRARSGHGELLRECEMPVMRLFSSFNGTGDERFSQRMRFLSGRVQNRADEMESRIDSAVGQLRNLFCCPQMATELSFSPNPSTACPRTATETAESLGQRAPS